MTDNKKIILSKHLNVNAGKIAYTVFLIAVVSAIFITQCFAATDMWSKATEIMKDVYGQIVAISTIAH